MIDRLRACRPATAQVERVHSMLTLTTDRNRTRLLAARLYKLVFLRLRFSNGNAALKWGQKLSKVTDLEVAQEGNALFELYTADDPSHFEEIVDEDEVMVF